MAKYILAVSGGVDSVVLLDMLSKRPDLELIVAHFDHGIRDDSADDAEFVVGLAEKYSLDFETKRENLGRNVSEEVARARRYKFLREIARKYDAKLVTAHHADDVVETIAINLSRGTGWRGLSAMDSDIIRPLTDMTKLEIMNYAKNNKLAWHEDSTNNSDDYLRNRIRRRLEKLDNDSRRQLLGLWAEQKHLKNEIDKETQNLIIQGSTLNDGSISYERYFFTHIDEASAMECLRYIVDARLTRPQLKKALHAIKTVKPHKIYHAGDGVQLNFTSRNFNVELLK